MRQLKNIIIEKLKLGKDTKSNEIISSLDELLKKYNIKLNNVEPSGAWKSFHISNSLFNKVITNIEISDLNSDLHDFIMTYFEQEYNDFSIYLKLRSQKDIAYIIIREKNSLYPDLVWCHFSSNNTIFYKFNQKYNEGKDVDRLEILLLNIINFIIQYK